MKLYGSYTSPYVRRVRVLAQEIGVPFEIVDTTTEDGAAALRARSPINKVPAAEIDGHVIWDSSAIAAHLLATRGHGPLRQVVDPIRESNLKNAIDGALDAAINVFYLEREGVSAKEVPYLRKQNDRVKASLEHVAHALRRGGYLTDDPRVGYGEIALVTTLEWFVFRKRYPVETIPELAEAMRVHADRPSFVATRPA